MDEVGQLHTQLVEAGEALTASRLLLEKERRTLQELTSQCESNVAQCEEAGGRLMAIREEIHAVQQTLKKLELSNDIAKQRTVFYRSEVRAVEATAAVLVTIFDRRSAVLRRCAATCTEPCDENNCYADLQAVSDKIRQIRNERKVRREMRTIKLRDERKFLLNEKIRLNKEMAILKQKFQQQKKKH